MNVENEAGHGRTGADGKPVDHGEAAAFGLGLAGGIAIGVIIAT